MISGLDTTFLIQFEVREHPEHRAARALLSRIVKDGHQLAIAPQVLAEFVHIATDARRFERPLSVSEAVSRAGLWWESTETKQVFQNQHSLKLFLKWMSSLSLGRKRILDTMLAATYAANGVQSIVTSNVRDFVIYDCFTLLVPDSSQN